MAAQGMLTPTADSEAACLAAFEAYQCARLDFAQDLAKLAVSPAHSGVSAGTAGDTHEVDGPEKVLAALEASDTLDTDVLGLMNDLAPSVQQCAMIAMGRICGLSAVLREQVHCSHASCSLCRERHEPVHCPLRRSHSRS